MDADTIDQTGEAAQQATVTHGHSWFHFVAHWPAQHDVLKTCHDIAPAVAALLVMLGIVYLLFGFNIYKGLVLLNAAVLGAALGAALGEANHIELPLAIVGAVAAAAITWPLMKWAVAVMGGLLGAVLGASLWQMCGLEAHFAWAGAMTGLVAFGLLSFILFRGCVMMYTSMQGSAMLICGIIALLSHHGNISNGISEAMRGKPFLLPLAIFIPAIVGLIYQQHNAAAPIQHKK